MWLSPPPNNEIIYSANTSTNFSAKLNATYPRDIQIFSITISIQYYIGIPSQKY